LGTCCAHRVNHKIILLREDCSEIEFESVVRDMADHWWSRIAQADSEVGQRTIPGNNIDRD